MRRFGVRDSELVRRFGLNVRDSELVGRFGLDVVDREKVWVGCDRFGVHEEVWVGCERFVVGTEMCTYTYSRTKLDRSVLNFRFLGRSGSVSLTDGST